MFVKTMQAHCAHCNFVRTVKKLEVDLALKNSSQSRFIQVVTHFLLPWFRVISLMYYGLPLDSIHILFTSLLEL